MATTEDLLVRIDATTEQLRREMRRADQTVQTSTRKMDRHLQRVDGAFTRLNKAASTVVRSMGALGIAFGAREVVQFAGRTIQNAEAIERQSSALGVTVEQFQELQFTFRQFGLDTDDISDALNTLADRAQDAKDGMQSFIDDFGLLGIEVDDLRGKDPQQLFRLFARAVGNIEDPTQRAAGVVRILGDDVGRRLLPLLQQGSAGLDEYADKARSVGAILSEDVVEGGAAASRQFRALREEINAESARTIVENADALANLAQTAGAAANGLLALGGAAGRAIGAVDQAIRTVEEPFVDTLNRLFADPEGLERVEELRGAISSINEEIAALQDRIPEGGTASNYIQHEIQRLQEEREALRSEMQNILQPPRQLGSPETDTPTQPINRPAQSTSGGSTASEPDEDPLGPVRDFEPPNHETTNRNLIDEAEQQLRAFDRQYAAAQRYGEQLQRIDQITAQLNLSQAEQNRLQGIARQEYLSTFETLDENSDRLRETAEGIGFAFSSAFEDAMLQAESFSDVLDGLLKDIARVLIRTQITQPLANSVANLPIFGGGKADGGPVAGGTTYLVGERGPELFTPGRSGTITPNDAMGGGVTVNVINQGGERLESEGQRQKRGPNGDLTVDVMVKSSMERLDSQGQLDGIFRRHGAKRQGQR